MNAKRQRELHGFRRNGSGSYKSDYRTEQPLMHKKCGVTTFREKQGMEILLVK